VQPGGATRGKWYRRLKPPAKRGPRDGSSRSLKVFCGRLLTILKKSTLVRVMNSNGMKPSYYARNRDRIRAYQRSQRLASPKVWKARIKAAKRKKPALYQALARRAALIHQAKVRMILWNSKAAPCADCGRKFDPVCMDFDHRPGTKKLRKHMMHVPLGRLRTEIKKCDVVCACCHRLRTKNRHQYNKRKYL